MDLICPICGSKLNTFDKSLVCAGHHCFDIARQGYVNLLTVQQKHSLHPGDTREQVLSRRAFLEACPAVQPLAAGILLASRRRLRAIISRVCQVRAAVRCVRRTGNVFRY